MEIWMKMRSYAFKRTNIRKILFSIFIILVVGILIFLILDKNVPPSRKCRQTGNSPYYVYYLLNIDGMKGLGHTALLLVDENGYGQVCSFNGMQYNLLECLLGKEGIGKMKQFSLEPTDVELLLETGDLQAGDYKECDNFDRALYRCLTKEQYTQIWKGIAVYIEVGNEFECLYANIQNVQEDDKLKAQEQMDLFLSKGDIPHYQIYTHNCDTVARELIALIDNEMAQYNISSEKLTPNGNFKNMCRRLGNTWGYMCLGEDSLVEKLLR